MEIKDTAKFLENLHTGKDNDVLIVTTLLERYVTLQERFLPKCPYQGENPEDSHRRHIPELLEELQRQIIRLEVLMTYKCVPEGPYGYWCYKLEEKK